MSDLKLTGDAKAMMDIVEKLGWEVGQHDMYKAEALMECAEDILERVVVVDVERWEAYQRLEKAADSVVLDAHLEGRVDDHEPTKELRDALSKVRNHGRATMSYLDEPETCVWCGTPLDDEPAGDGTLCADCLKDKHDAMLEEEHERRREEMQP